MTVIGVPLGIVAGQWVWRAFAANLGVVPVAVVPVWLVVGLAAGVVRGANILAIAPALAGQHDQPGTTTPDGVTERRLGQAWKKWRQFNLGV